MKTTIKTAVFGIFASVLLAVSPTAVANEGDRFHQANIAINSNTKEIRKCAI